MSDVTNVTSQAPTTVVFPFTAPRPGFLYVNLDGSGYYYTNVTWGDKSWAYYTSWNNGGGGNQDNGYFVPKGAIVTEAAKSVNATIRYIPLCIN